MAANPGSISSQPAAATLTGAELLPLDQDIGSPVAVTALTVGQGYRIVSLGNTNWQTVGAGASAAVGTVFRCEAVGTGTGTAQRVDTRRVTAQALAALAGVAAAILAHSQAEDPHSVYTTAQELSSALQNYLTTSAAAQAYQPLSTNLANLAAVANQTAFGRAFLALADQAGARDYIGLGPDDTATLTGLTLTGLAILPHIHGNLAGGLYAHVKNVSGALAAGTPLRVTGTVGNTTTLEVVAASASSAGTMPALFVLSEPLANNAEGHATLLGEITGLNTAGLTPGAPLFVPSGGGVLTATRPAANAQQMATVGRAHATTGSVHVLPWPVLGTAAAAATADFDPAGAASAAITAHLLAASHHAPASLAASLQAVFGLSGQELAAQSPGAGLTRLHYWNPATSRLEFLSLGTGLSIASGQLNAADLYNLLLPSAAGTYFQYLCLNPTNLGTGAAGSVSTSALASSSSLPNMGRLDTGSTTAGAAALVHTSGSNWTGTIGKLSLQAIRSFQTTIWFATPTALSGGANTYRIFFGWLDAAVYSARNSIGLLINGSALTITSTVAGVESSTALATVAANTNYKVTLIYDAPTATISANINGEAYTTFTIPSTPTTLGMLGVFIVKETGTTNIAMFTSVPQIHTWLSC